MMTPWYFLKMFYKFDLDWNTDEKDSREIGEEEEVENCIYQNSNMNSFQFRQKKVWIYWKYIIKS